MADTVKVPLLGTHKKGTVVGVTIGGVTVSVFLIYRQVKKNKEAQAAAAQANVEQAQAASGYGYGSYGYGTGAYPAGYFGYGSQGGFPGQVVEDETDNDDTDRDVTQTPKPRHKDTFKKVPSVVGLQKTLANSRLRSDGFRHVEDRGGGNIVISQQPKAGARVDPDSTPVILHLERVR